MDSQIIHLDIRRSPEWPPGRLGDALERLAQEAQRRAEEHGRKVSIEKCRRAALSALRTPAPREP